MTENNTTSTSPQYISEIRFKGNIETKSYLSNLPIVKFLSKIKISDLIKA